MATYSFVVGHLHFRGLLPPTSGQMKSSLLPDNSKSLFIWHDWGIGCADREIFSLDRMVTYEMQF